MHEVGHQGAALLDLVNSLRPLLKQLQRDGDEGDVWRYWERWISEILADFWSVARVGVASTLGLMAVVSLPRAFVFRARLDDPHPIPWIRVKLSCALGQALYPHSRWDRLARLWESFYPRAGLDETRRSLLARLEAGLPDFVNVLISHRPEALRGSSLGEAMELQARQPARLTAYYENWRIAPARMYAAPPSLVFAVLGQARAENKISPEGESDLLAKLLTHWALQKTLDTAAVCRMRPQANATAASA